MEIRSILDQAATLTVRLNGRADATAEALRRAANDAGFYITGDDRIGETDLAMLLGWSAGTLANRRREGKAPPHYLVSAASHRVTYRIGDVAVWIEARRE